MSPSQFIPARSSRHRVACIALYRALVREARAIPLPDDVLRKGTQNPIPRLVKKAFGRNRTETSYRIVFSALGTGYNFLNLFKAAQTPNSKEHSQIIAHLREKKLRDAKSEAGKPPPRPPRPEKPKWPPLLQRTSKDDEPPTYISPRFPVPRENLTGARRVPHVAITAEGIAFLRQKKLQDHSVALYVQQKTRIKRRTMDLLLSSMREDMPWAADEDRWEEIVKKEMQAARRQETWETRVRGERPVDQDRLAAGGREREVPDRLRQGESYGQMVTENWKFASKRLDDLMAQQAARAKAFVEIRKAEKEMLEKDNDTYLSRGHRWMVDTPEKKMERHKQFRMDFRTAKIERKAKRREKNKWRRVRGLEPAPVAV
ncbi:DNA repair protein [Colletotrichum tofieldiae]|uniref:DNA repair protein n=1 Tax=Colletotrichum tofieldiae TaxID=708197 RepID=A0A161VRD7_9PEZI|nr:DNA repair protein [Colletotrichum tofieldiae]GKT67614.1 DNA repair protein [Colletotrichum tofieldiae]GKT91434.1 DNA repair protein [Colletotrichum tofieldiae]